VKPGMDWKKLLGSISESVDEEIRQRNAYLATENRILRNQITGRVQLSAGDRQALAEIGQKLGQKALEEIATIATAATILAWHRKFATHQRGGVKPRKSIGRPRIDQELEGLVIRMAQENRSWGYDRIVGALTHLGYSISDQTVGNILKRHGIPPAPERKKTTTWAAFIRIHMDVFMGTDFFTTAVWSWFELVIGSLFSILFGRYKGDGASITLSCNARWRLSLLTQMLNCYASAKRCIYIVKEEELSRRSPCGDRVPPLMRCEVATQQCRDPFVRCISSMVSSS